MEGWSREEPEEHLSHFFLQEPCGEFSSPSSPAHGSLMQLLEPRGQPRSRWFKICLYIAMLVYKAMGKSKNLELVVGIEPTTSSLQANALTTTPSCCYTYIVHKIDIYFILMPR